jgi:SAM-dependent methyltransferase
VYLPVLAKCFSQVIASDVEDAYLENARAIAARVPNLRCERDDIAFTRLPKQSFDVILCTEVVEHVVDSRTAIAQMHSLLKPNGTLILSTPQRYSPLEVVGKVAFLPGIIDVVRLIYQEPILETGHINLMTEKTVREQITSAGFKIVETHKSGMYVPLLAEFGGQAALRCEQYLETRLRGSALSWLLWTQYYVARA